MQREDVALVVCSVAGTAAYALGYPTVGVGLFGLGGALKALIPAKKPAT